MWEYGFPHCAPNGDHSGDGERGGELGSPRSFLAPVWECCPRLGGKGTLLCGALLPLEPPQRCAGNCWSAGGRGLQLEGGQERALLGLRPAGLGRGRQQVFPVADCNGVDRRQVGRGRQGSQETSLWLPLTTVLGSKADTMFQPLSLGRL